MRLKVIRGAAGLSVLLSGFASALALCCSVPWVVALLGVSGAILFARVGEFRPYFIGAAALLMGLALWSSHRFRRECAINPGKQRRQWALNVALVVGLVALVVAIFSSRIEILLQRLLSP